MVVARLCLSALPQGKNNHGVGTVYPILLYSEHGTWTLNASKRHVVLKVTIEAWQAFIPKRLQLQGIIYCERRCNCEFHAVKCSSQFSHSCVTSRLSIIYSNRPQHFNDACSTGSPPFHMQKRTQQLTRYPVHSIGSGVFSPSASAFRSKRQTPTSQTCSCRLVPFRIGVIMVRNRSKPKGALVLHLRLFVKVLGYDFCILLGSRQALQIKYVEDD